MNFKNLNIKINLVLYQSSITKIDKKMFDEFPSLLYLTITRNKQLRIIDANGFSNLKHLCYLNLSENRIRSIGKRHFSGRNKLQTIDLSNNRLERLRKDVVESQVEIIRLSEEFKNVRLVKNLDFCFCWIIWREF